MLESDCKHLSFVLPLSTPKTHALCNGRSMHCPNQHPEIDNSFLSDFMNSFACVTQSMCNTQRQKQGARARRHAPTSAKHRRQHVRHACLAPLLCRGLLRCCRLPSGLLGCNTFRQLLQIRDEGGGLARNIAGQTSQSKCCVEIMEFGRSTMQLQSAHAHGNNEGPPGGAGRALRNFTSAQTGRLFCQA